MPKTKSVSFGSVEAMGSDPDGDNETESFAPDGMSAEQARNLRKKRKFGAAGLDDDDDGSSFAVRPSSAFKGEEHNPMDSLKEVDAGATVTAFNMTEEMDEGFVQEGEYVANEFDQRVQKMMQNSSDEDEAEQDMFGDDDEEARAPKHVLSKKERRRQKELQDGEKDAWLDEEVNAVEPAYEDPSSGKQRKRPRGGSADASKSSEPRAGADSEITRGKNRSNNAKSSFDEVTEIADELLNAGHYTIYQMKREELLRKSGIVVGDTAKSTSRRETGTRAGGTDERGQRAGNSDRWELRWGQDAEIHGPFSSEEMLGWLQSGYFGTERKAFARRATPGAEFAPADSFTYGT